MIDGFEQGAYAWATGNELNTAAFTNSCIRTVNYIEVIPGNSYEVNISNKIGKDLIVWVYEYDEEQAFISVNRDMTSYVPFAFTASSTTKYIKVVFTYLTSSSGSTSSEYTLNVSDVYSGILL